MAQEKNEYAPESVLESVLGNVLESRPESESVSEKHGLDVETVWDAVGIS